MSKLSNIGNMCKNDTEIESRSLRSRIVEDFIVIWLDSAINEINENTESSINQLQHIVHTIKTFRDSDQCIDFITDVKYEKVFLIISGSLGHKLVPLIENITQINSIYILCRNKQIYEEWAIKYQIVRGVFTRIQYICDALKQDVHESENSLTPISIVSTTSSTNMNELDQSYMYSQLLKEILLEFPPDPTSKTELVDFCRIQYADSPREVKVIDEFGRDYDHPSPIWWYTRECFTYSMLNKALRTQDIEIILKMGFFIRDLHQQIHQHSESNNQQQFVVYGSQGMLNEEFEKMKRSRERLLSFNNFLSTSTVKEVSIKFDRRVRNNPDLTAILFQTQVDPSISSTPFACLDKISYYSQLNIATCYNNTGGVLKKQGKYAETLKNHERAFEIKRNHLSSRHPSLATTYNNIAGVHLSIGDKCTALSYYEKTLEIKQKSLPSNHPLLSITYSNIATVPEDLHGYREAMDHAKRAVDITQDTFQTDHFIAKNSQSQIDRLKRNL
jgi:hypothetical protein